MKILGIETSCDETAVCLIEVSGEFEGDFRFSILGNTLASQAKLHAQYGGVFPNIAKREHQKALTPLLETVLREAGELKNCRDDILTIEADLGRILAREPELLAQLRPFLEIHARPAIDAIAVTHGPGLEPALWVGINFAKALSAAWAVPIVPVNHMEGHIVLSAMKVDRLASFKFPLLSLLISGGHTELVLSRQWLQYEILGATRDDAVGEAFDKVARLLGLPYPGGPHISALAEMARKNAEQTQNDAEGIPRQSASGPHGSALSLPRPMIDSDNYDFSFAGLKTAVRRVVESHESLSDSLRMEIAREFEDAAADVLVAKTTRAIEEYDVQTILVGGGVSANTHIREEFASAIKNYGLSTTLLIPPPALATDNALMIALAGYFRALKKEFAAPDTISAHGNLRLA